MNGRIQDPALGKFLSADPNIQDPGDSQSFNRYAYVQNRPLSATDPSGFAVNGQGSGFEESANNALHELGNALGAQVLTRSQVFDIQHSLGSGVEINFFGRFVGFDGVNFVAYSNFSNSFSAGELAHGQDIINSNFGITAPSSVAGYGGSGAPGGGGYGGYDAKAASSQTTGTTGGTAASGAIEEIFVTAQKRYVISVPALDTSNFFKLDPIDINEPVTPIEEVVITAKCLAGHSCDHAQSAPDLMKAYFGLLIAIDTYAIGGEAEGVAAVGEAGFKAGLFKLMANVDRHHSFPKYLGGAAKQDLVELTSKLHIEYHRRLDDIASRFKGAAGFAALGYAEQQRKFQDIILMTQKFDEEFGTNLSGAMKDAGLPGF